jgi:high frequency lysogenization protein
MSDERDRVLALAGVFQAAALAQQLARRGYEDEAPFEASVRSLFIKDAINTASVFGGEPGLKLGLQTMRDKLSTSGKQSDLDIARYVLGLTQLGQRLARHDVMSHAVAIELEQVKSSAPRNNGEGMGASVYEELAHIYKSSISQLKPKIIVQGEHGHLASPIIVDKVRTILFAGVRAAFLWSQLGGRRLHLLLQRKQMLAWVDEILAEAET